jgi:hypothetical protein
MPRRRELRGAAHGLLGAFVSRNNDVAGYWALGKLYKHAKATSVDEVRVDLVKSTIMPPNAQFAGMIEFFNQMLASQLEARGLPSDWLTAAEIAVRFTGQKDANQPGDTFECSVTLTDDRRRPHQARASGACWVHSAFRESKSTRV